MKKLLFTLFITFTLCQLQGKDWKFNGKTYKLNEGEDFPSEGDLGYPFQEYKWENKLKGTGSILPGTDKPRVTEYDKARAYLGQWIFTVKDKDGLANDPHFLTKKEISDAQVYVTTHTMKGFKATLPDINEKGEVYQQYKKNSDYSRNMYSGGTEKMEDIITASKTFNAAFNDMKKIYREPIMRNNPSFAKESNWYYSNDVPADFPEAFWAYICFEGRIMKVIIANDKGTGYRLAVSYWATPDFKKDFPYASWAWKGEDKALSGVFSKNKKIVENLRPGAVMEPLEFKK